MTDPVRKLETIRRIERLQLPSSLIPALDDALTAEKVLNALDSLQALTEHWN
ncbi:hypothetical protein [Acinetobacter sp. NCu2D-2]|uniref:hypothetical protein n=1 Tax=Acinetobacter sp. NCu2D-2 TaxID=1608473 RepID=UPI000B241B54|nr:hypothetical protein [Acinetobacter sp. NCu2D-2]